MAPARAAECAPPAAIGDGWEIANPAAADFNSAALGAVLAKVAGGADNIHGVVIERHGHLVAELYRTGPDLSIDVWFGLWHPFASPVEFGPTKRHDIRSISKSIIGLLIGIAKEHGVITDLTTPALAFYPEYAELRAADRERIDLEHLLTMSSGLAWDEGALPNDETKLYWHWAPYRYVLSRPIVAPPGARFNYNSGGTAVLADILLRRSGKPLNELVRTQLFEPLGITDWGWVVDLHGRNLAFTGLRMRPRDLLKIGRLLLDHGQWHGQQIVPAAWVTESLRPHISTGFHSPPNAASELQYGYQWWMGTSPWQGKSLAWSAGFGNGGQRLFMLPELDLTVVITAGDYGSLQMTHTVNQLFNDIVATVQR